MTFERFDRNQVARPDAPAGPVVRVDHTGRLLFNGAAAEFLAMQYGTGPQLEVSLLFDSETRRAAVRPIVRCEEIPDDARYQVLRMRSTEWPAAVNARTFVEHWRIGAGEYRAQLMRGPGPRMVTFDVGPRGRLPAGAPSGVVLVEELPADGTVR